MRKWSWLLGVVMLMALGTGAIAQEEYEYRDVAEVLVYGGVSVPSGGITNFLDTLGAKTGWDVGVSAGVFLTPSLVLGLDFTYAQYGIDTDNDMITLKHRFYNPMLYVRCHNQPPCPQGGQPGWKTAAVFYVHPPALRRWRRK